MVFILQPVSFSMIAPLLPVANAGLVVLILQPVSFSMMAPLVTWRESRPDGFNPTASESLHNDPPCYLLTWAWRFNPTACEFLVDGSSVCYPSLTLAWWLNLIASEFSIVICPLAASLWPATDGGSCISIR